MTPDISELSREELEKEVENLRLQLELGDGNITKKDIIKQIADIVGLDEENDLMNTSDEYNIGLRKSGWLKLYKSLVQEKA